ncbi:MAG: hypothetical protein ABI724_19270 [Betaproteobacteria bacterium]
MCYFAIRDSEIAIAAFDYMNPFFLIAVCVSVLLGIWHLNIALQAMFLFRSGEPLMSWIAILVGPASTLPAAILALWSSRGGGYWLVAGGVISLMVFAIGERGGLENILPFVLRISMPMILSGASIAFLSRARA